MRTFIILLSFFGVCTAHAAELSWAVRPAGSIQLPALSLGATPLERRLGLSGPEKPRFPHFLREEAVAVARLQADRHGGRANLRLWPTRETSGGQWVWVYAEGLDAGLELPTADLRSGPILPQITGRWTATNRRRVFEGQGLYDLPRFSDGIWENRRTGERLEWPAPELREVFLSTERDRLAQWVFTELPQRPEFNGVPVEFNLAWRDGRPHWGTELEDEPTFAEEEGEKSTVSFSSPDWPADFQAHYRAGIQALIGETEAVFPVSGRRMRFQRKNAADPAHQLEAFVDYLEEQYLELGRAWPQPPRLERQRFVEYGAPQSNLIVKLPAAFPSAKLPLVLADHIDTAYAETHFEYTGQRVSVPGADDNASATQALLEAARILGPLSRDREIWLVHLTGEEFPADCMGARHLAAQWLNQGVELEGVVVLDMIAFVPEGADPSMFQIHPGRTAGTQFLTNRFNYGTRPIHGLVRAPHDPRSYLFNTDGIVFDDAGYRTVLINEPMNAIDFFDRPHYHQLTDSSATLDYPYAEKLLQRVFFGLSH